MKKINSLLLLFATMFAMTFTLQTTFVSCTNDDNSAVTTTDSTSVLNNAEISALIDEDLKLIASQGYGNLVIPQSIHKIQTTAFSEDTWYVANKLIENGYTAYVVGGGVRDLIAGWSADDFDIVTNATHEQMEAIFGDRLLTHYAGELRFEQVNVADERDNIDLATYQQVPAEYRSSDKASIVANIIDGTLIGDSFERDFAFNAIYYDCTTGDLIDYHGGLADLRDHNITSIFDPLIQFETNATSAIRGIRFQSKYQYTFTSAIEEALQNHALEYMKKIPKNSCFYNLNKLFNGGYATTSYANLIKYGVFDHFFPLTASLDATEYKTYAESLMKQLDADESLRTNAFALILYPAFKAQAATMDVDAAAKAVLDSEEEIMNLYDSEKEQFTKVWKEMWEEENTVATAA